MYTPIEPYTDELMRWDADAGRYYLTEAALIRNGIDLRSRLAANKATAPEYIIERLLRTVTELIYNHLHLFSLDTSRQDALIASVPSMRRILYTALVDQAIYVLSVGDLTLSPDRDKRAMAVDVKAQDILNQTLPELGVPITYAGRY